MDTATIIILALIKAGTWIVSAAAVAHIIVKGISRMIDSFDEDHVASNKTGGLIPYSDGPHLHFSPGWAGYSSGTHEDDSPPPHLFDSDTSVTEAFNAAYGRNEDNE